MGKERKERLLLDDPMKIDTPSERRHTAYLFGVIALGFILNLLVMVLLGGV